MKEAKLHSFAPQIAKKVGLKAAILYHNIQYWTKQNEKKKSKRHLHNGRYWMYNSVREFHNHLLYLSQDEIRRALKQLVEKGLILEGNFHKNKSFRSKWYTPTTHLTEEPDHHLAEEPNVYTDSKEQIKKNIGFSGMNSIYIFLEKKEGDREVPMHEDHYLSLEAAFNRHEPEGNFETFLLWVYATSRRLTLSKYHKWTGLKGMIAMYNKLLKEWNSFKEVEWTEKEEEYFEKYIASNLPYFLDRFNGAHIEHIAGNIGTELCYSKPQLIKKFPNNGFCVREFETLVSISDFLNQFFPQCTGLIQGLPVYLEFVVKGLIGSLDIKAHYIKKYWNNGRPSEQNETTIRFHASLMAFTPYSIEDLEGESNQSNFSKWKADQEFWEQWHNDDYIKEQVNQDSFIAKNPWLTI